MIKRYFSLLITLMWFVTALPHAFASELIRYNISEQYPDPKQAYYIDLLTLALEETKIDYGGYQLQPVPVEMSQGRTSIMVELDHGIDVTWRMTTNDIEQRMLAIYVPLLKGLMGYRIFIIRKDEQARFPIDISKAQLAQLIAGQGHDWPDSDILINNEMKVVTGPGNRLLDMLAKKRYDYFPRALHEPWIEIANRDTFIVEQNIMFKYPAPIYFFVNQKNKSLRDRITLGLNRAIDNGKFDDLFLNHPVTKNILSLAQIEQRKVFEFKNTLLSDASRALITDSRLWLTNLY